MRRICMRDEEALCSSRATNDVSAEVGNPTLRGRVESPHADLRLLFLPS